MKILQRNRHTLQTHSSSFLTQRTYYCSNFVAIFSLVLINKEMPGSVARGTPCSMHKFSNCLSIYLSGLVTAVAVFRNPNTIPFCLTTDLLLNVLISWLYTQQYCYVMNRINTNYYKEPYNGLLHSVQASASNKPRPIPFIPVHHPPFSLTL